MSLTFSELGVPQPICDALEQRGITHPFEIQAATIADALAGRDVCGRAPTGSGKTLAFGIPLVASVERATSGKPRALVLVPTRELAEQISSELESIAGRVRIGVVYGGVSYSGQIQSLRRGADILVACPGRLEDLIAQNLADLSDVDRVVIDEADRMADMGFMPAVRRLLDQTAASRQTVLFSATLDGDVAKLTAAYQNNPVRHEVGEETPDVTAADHVFWKTGKANRTELTIAAVNAVWPAFVFSRTRHGSDRLARQLTQSGVAAVAIHGGRSQSQRNRALADFAKGKVQALVATDVAARGIHVDGVAAVIHFDPPEDHKAYIHRSGRTARAGQGGVILSLVQPDQVKSTRRMQSQIGLRSELTEPDARALGELSNLVTGPKPKVVVEREERPRRVGPSGNAERPRRNGGPRSRPTGRDGEGRPDRDDQRPRRDRPARPADGGSERNNAGSESEGGRRPRGGLNLTTRTRAPRGEQSPSEGYRGSPRSSSADGERPRSDRGPRTSSGASSSSGAAGDRRGPSRYQGAGPTKGTSAGGAVRTGSSRSGTPRPKNKGAGNASSATNRKNRRAHLQWS